MSAGGRGPGEGEWALVLGASVGTGAAVAVELGREAGLHVFGVHRGRHPEEAEAVRARVADAGRRCRMFTGDGGGWDGVQAAADQVLAEAGPRSVRVMVHSLAGASVARLVTGPGAPPAAPRQIERTFEVMAHSFVWWVQALWERDLLTPQARLVGLTNPMEDQVLRGTALIAAAKGALGAYVRHMARELAPHGHRVNLVKFGAAVTPALATTLGRDQVDGFAGVAGRAHPAGRLVTVEEVARFVRSLVGEAGEWFNGATIDFTGGEVQGLYDALAFPVPLPPEPADGREEVRVEEEGGHERPRR